MQLDKLFSIKKPCKDCPFRKDGYMLNSLRPGRIEEIIEALNNDAPFHCHKTIDYDKTRHVKQVEDAVYCAGALIYMEKAQNRNLPMRLGMAYDLYDPALLQGHDEVIDPEEE